MKALTWNAGMSVGIDAIDDDHKQIIAILAKLTSTHCGNISKLIIENIFIELEEYVSLHFAREEALLEKAGYKDLIKHKASHQKFIERLPILKKEWLEEDNLACSERIVNFLHHWIVNHILEDDLDYVPTLHNSSLPTVKKLSNTDKNSKNSSLLDRLSLTLSQKVKLNKRVFITAFIPVLGVFMLSLVMLKDNYQHYKNMGLLLSLNNVIIKVNDMTHSLQSERGLSSALASSNYQRFNKELFNTRAVTDEFITKFLLLTKNESDPSVQYYTQSYFSHVHEDIKELATHRQHLDEKTANFEQTYQAYTLLIEKLLSITENLTDVDSNSQLANNISAISSMLMFKEYLGQIRAIGLSILRDENNDIYSNQDISLLVGKQIHAVKLFNSSANSEQQKICGNFCNEKVYMQVLKEEFFNVMNKEDLGLRGKTWFSFMTKEIDKLKVLTDSLTINFKNTMLIESQNARIKYLVTFFALSVFLLGVLLFSLILNFSIITPIRRVTDALNNMTKGDLSVHFTRTTIKDEIGAIQLAYEKLRRKLLQVDIFQAVVDSQKEEIEFRKNQQEHFKILAYTDALTGAVNRHQFNKVLGEEISRANYEHKPLSILLLDIDYFKKINDSFGHGVGDEVLVLFYKACKEAARGDDVVARIGGEEFVIVLPKTDIINAYQFAERLRKKVEHLNIVIENNEINFTVSIGVSEWKNNSFSCAEAFVADADKSLYLAKEQGRNRVIC